MLATLTLIYPPRIFSKLHGKERSNFISISPGTGLDGAPDVPSGAPEKTPKMHPNSTLEIRAHHSGPTVNRSFQLIAIQTRRRWHNTPFRASPPMAPTI